MGLEHRAAARRAVRGAAGRAAARSLARALAAAVAGYALLVAPVALLDVASFLGRATAPSAPGPGLGLVNLLAYRGAERRGRDARRPWRRSPLSPRSRWLLTRPWPTLARAGIASLLGIVLAPSLVADAVAAPILLLTLAALVPRARWASNGKRTTENRERTTEKRTTENETTDKRQDGWTGLEGGIPPP